MTKILIDEATVKLALEALEYIEHNYMSLPAPAEKAITSLREALAEQPAQQALDKMAENARELGLDYEPAQQEPVAWYDSKTGWTDFHSFKPTRKPSAPDAEWLPLYATSPQPRETNQEPVLWMMPDGKTVNKWGLQFYSNVVGTPLYTSPPAQRTWVHATEWRGLTDEEIDELSRTMVKGNKSVNWLCRAVEAAHGIKGENK